MSDGLFDPVALIGIGLIGVLARPRPAARQPPHADRRLRPPRGDLGDGAPRRLDLADETTDDPAEAASGADLVVIATPLSAYAEIGRRIAPALKKGAVLTDVGSVKQAVIRDLGPHVPSGFILSRAIRSPGPSTPDRSPASPSSLPAAGAL